MKKLILSFAVIATLGFTSCSDDDDNNDNGSDPCQTCNIDLLGTSLSTEYCDNGDGTYTITVFGEEQVVDLGDDETFADVIAAVEAAGSACN
ncbi:MAG: hypothetical protein AB8B52_02795 [Winogradskyella sp.]|uniref:hypothetical protein n=1 Tax=Winogradskyella sp. TaxID=1883156 RepID=UPI00385C6503